MSGITDEPIGDMEFLSILLVVEMSSGLGKMSLTKVNASFNTRSTSKEGDFGTTLRLLENPFCDEEEDDPLRNKPANCPATPCSNI